MMVFYFHNFEFDLKKGYRVIKWVPSIIFNHIPTHIVPNLKVTPAKLPLWHQKMETLVCQDPCHMYVTHCVIMFQHFDNHFIGGLSNHMLLSLSV